MNGFLSLLNRLGNTIDQMEKQIATLKQEIEHLRANQPEPTDDGV